MTTTANDRAQLMSSFGQIKQPSLSVADRRFNIVFTYSRTYAMYVRLFV